jgi:hypothetical protein
MFAFRRPASFRTFPRLLSCLAAWLKLLSVLRGLAANGHIMTLAVHAGKRELPIFQPDGFPSKPMLGCAPSCC